MRHVRRWGAGDGFHRAAEAGAVVSGEDGVVVTGGAGIEVTHTTCIFTN